MAGALLINIPTFRQLWLLRRSSAGDWLRLVCMLLAFMHATMYCAYVQIAAADEEEEEVETADARRGVVATYKAVDGTTVRRVDRWLNFDWAAVTPDTRIGNQDFSAIWEGNLSVPRTGQYRFSMYLAGHCSIQVNGRTVLEGTSDQATWIRDLSDGVLLEAGDQPIAITFRRASQNGSITILWDGPGLYREPLGPMALSHSHEFTPSTEVSRGGEFVRDARCDACHAVGQKRQPLAAPALDRVRSAYHFDWLVQYLTDSAHSETRHQGHRPGFALSSTEAQIIVNGLWHAGEGERSNVNGAVKPIDSSDRDRGRELVMTMGCLACHNVEGLGANNDGSFGGRLDAIATKRPGGFVAKWLASPELFNRDHRMPLFELTEPQRRDMESYIMSLATAADTSSVKATSDARTDRDSAKDLLARWRCEACHRLPDQLSSGRPEPVAINDVGSAEACYSAIVRSSTQPRYSLSDADRQATIAYLNANASLQMDDRNETPGQQTLDAVHHDLRELGCLQCHARGESQGLAPIVRALAKRERRYEKLTPAMIPPSLEMVGDKLTSATLAQAVAGTSAARRPWLAVRMPKPVWHTLAATELAHALERADHTPDLAPSELVHDEGTLQIAGTRLVTADGLGCTSCHSIGGVEPVKSALNTRGPELGMIGQRVRPTWFQRWVRNPLRVVPRVEMPAVEVPVPGVLHGHLNDQIHAVWHVLNAPDFRPPPPDAVRIVRQSGTYDTSAQSVVITDNIKVDGDTLVKPLLIALPNRHNVLLDLERQQLVSWFVGDAARQRNNGKLWYWETAGTTMLSGQPAARSEIEVIGPNGPLAPVIVGQASALLDAWTHHDGGVTIERRMYLEASGNTSKDMSAERAAVQVRESITPIWKSESRSESGWERAIELRGVPTGHQVQIEVVPTEFAAKWGWDGTTHAFSSKSADANGETRIRVATASRPLDIDAGRVIMPSPDVLDETLKIVFRYETQLSVDEFAESRRDSAISEPVVLDVIPGMFAERLALPTSIMPTAMGVALDGSLILCSLKGEVWRVPEPHAKQTPLAIQKVSDELSAPYGVACTSDAIDVVTKFGVVRLSQFDQKSGRAHRSDVIASGWGHSADYHDWAVGLPRDAEGNYWVALPCQQDDRSLAAAHLRGRVLKLVPRTPSANDPRLFDLHEVSGGHRFPMGIAINRSGIVVVTDNQGNYNPFNELNHVLPGHRYGFVNAMERVEEITVPTTPPAIAIPHPWTRSVNGICFLETPPGVGDAKGEDIFGPWAGHLIGCEYDTRRLVRMSLQMVDGVLQGAVYPLSREASTPERSLLGPVNSVVALDGSIYVAELRDAGWGAGPNIGGVVRLRMEQELVAGIAEVTAIHDGFKVTLARPMSVTKLRNARYRLASYTRIATPEYGGPDVQRREETIRSVDVDPHGKFVILRLDSLRAGFVYELYVRDITEEGELFFPDEAHITVNRIP